MAPLARTDSADGSVTRWTLPGGERVELQRDADGMAVHLTSPGFARSFERDACGRIISVNDTRDGATSTTTLRRDLAGRVVEQEIDGAVTTYIYDDAGQLVRVASPDGVVSGSTTTSVASLASAAPRVSAVSSTTPPINS